ncbi:MAG: ABC transporter permease [Blastocatellia bacterium]|nr:ABC transporter permease [Blastocatellia bacterium]MBN8721293.1 ABC transporter permease [Acidobacteriota bacterium]
MQRILDSLLFPLLAVVSAFLVGGIIVFLVGDNPLRVYEIFFASAFGTIDGISYTLFYATPLIFTGLAVAVAFRCGLLNIGAEGQLYVAAFAAAWVGFTLDISQWVVIPLCMIAAIVAGAIWGGIPGILKSRFGSHEVINTIMMNFIAVGITSYFTQYYYRLPGDPILQTKTIFPQAQIPRMSAILGTFGINFPAWLPLNFGFFIAIFACIFVYIFLWKTKWGYELRAVGANASAAEYGGINVGRSIVLAMCISGALAGLVGINEVLGYRYRYYDGFSANYGFTGIAVALLGRNHPLGIFLAALLFGALVRGGLFVNIFSDRVSKDLVVVLQAVIILFVACEAIFQFLQKRNLATGKN